MKPALPTLLAALALASSACHRATEVASRPDTVHIDQTPVKDQGGVGFCWSYTTMGLFESIALRDNLKLDLSEEYLGFYRILEGLREALASENPQAAMAKFSEGYTNDLAITLAESVGIVPESVFSKKFPATGSFGDEVKQAFSERFGDARKVAAYRQNESLLRSDLEALFGVRVPRPTDNFTWNGRTYTPQTFARDVVKVRASDFQTFRVLRGDPQSAEIAYHYMKVALMNRIAVPVAMSILQNVEGGVWDSSQCQGLGCDTRDGHAMLAVDFVNQGGRGGEMPASEALRVFNSPLEAIIVKNSWGVTTGLDQDGNPASGARTGYNMIRRNYLDESSVQGFMAITVPRFVTEQKTGLVPAGLKVAVEAPTVIAPAGQAQTFKALLLSTDSGSGSSGVTFSWALRRAGGESIASGNGREFQAAPTAPGLYELSLTAKTSTSSHTARKAVWVGESHDFRKLTGAIAATNFARYTWNDGVASYQFDTREGQKAVDANLATIALPPVDFEKGGRVDFYLNSELKEGLHPRLQASSDGGRTFESIFCYSANPDVKGSRRVRCPFPANGAGTVKAERVIFRLASENMPQEKYKTKALQEVTELTALMAGADVVTLSEPAFAAASYPKGAAFKNVMPLGASVELTAHLDLAATAVRIYRGGSVVKEIPADSLPSIDVAGEKKRVASFPAQVTMPGASLFRFVAMVDDVESSSVNYEVLAAPEFSFSASMPFSADLRQSIPFAFDTGWFATPLGISASPFSESDRMVRKLENSGSGTAAFVLNLGRTRGNRLELKAHHNLEPDFDFLYVRVSDDNGKSWHTLAARTGVSRQAGPGSQQAWNTVVVDLSAFDGKKVLVRLDVETDLGARSDWLLIRSLLVSGH